MEVFSGRIKEEGWAYSNADDCRNPPAIQGLQAEQRMSPAKVRQIQSFIGEYCAAQGFDDAVSEYGLDAFDVRANSLERTFCDKVFALCDYYLSGEIPSRQLRHIYDLKKLSGAVDMDDDLLNLMTVVREQRVGGFRCPSADAGVSIPATLREIVSTAAYKADYERLTMPLLYEGIS